MDINQFTQPAQMERNSFMWSQARLVIAAVALFAGGVPPVVYLIKGGGVWSLLRICWIISGVASGYLGYRWLNNRQHVFGGKEKYDTIAFLVGVISGLNLGWAGLAGNNIGMSITSNHIVFYIVGALYLLAAYQLQQRFRAHGHKIF